MRHMLESEIQHRGRLILGQTEGIIGWRNETATLPRTSLDELRSIRRAITAGNYPLAKQMLEEVLRRGMVAAGLCRGSSDWIGLGPGGRFLAIEFKKPGGKPTLEQGLFLDLIRNRGGYAAVCDSLRSIEEARDNILKGNP